MSNQISVRLASLNMPLLGAAEVHGRRLDDAAISRKVREAESLTWVPEGITGDPLALSDRLADHLSGEVDPATGKKVPVHVHKAKTKALHMLLIMPDSVPTETEEDARKAMLLGVRFAQETLGGEAVFAARIDRDEESTNTVDLFLAPLYDKVLKAETKRAMSLTKHTKLLVDKHDIKIETKTIKKDGVEVEQSSAYFSMKAQGQALQTEFAQWLTKEGYVAERGSRKKGRANDRKSPEVMGAKRDREKAEKAYQDALESEERAAAALRVVESRELAVSGRETAVSEAEDAIETRERAVQRKEDGMQAIADKQKATRDEQLARSTALNDQARQIRADDAALKIRDAELKAKESSLAAVLDELDRIVQPIIDMAKQWNDAAGIMAQAVRVRLGAKGNIAAETADSAEVGVLTTLMDRLKGVKR